MNAPHMELSAACTFTSQSNHEEPSKYDEPVDYSGGEEDVVEVEPQANVDKARSS